MSEQAVVYETKQVVVLNDDIIKRYICPLATEQERYMFLQLCKGQNLNPFLREAYLIKYGTSPATMVVGKDTFIKRARSIQAYRGFKAGIIVISNKAVVYREGGMLIKGEELIGGWSEVYRSDLDVPVRVEVSLEEYIGKKKIWKDNAVVGEEINAQWAAKPATMIRKVALVQAHREAFPDQFEGLYSGEEMGIDVEAIPEYRTDKPAEGYKPPMQEPAEKKQKGEKDLRTEITRMIKEMAGSESEGLVMLKTFSGFTGKHKETGVKQWVEGKDDVTQIGDKVLPVVYGKAKEEYEKWRAKQAGSQGDSPA